MLSLIVALPFPSPAAEDYRFVLARTGTATTDFSGTGTGAGIEHGLSPLGLLPPADEVVAVVPVRALSWHRITIPKVNRARLRNVLEGMLEDRLLADPQALHFALEPGAAPGEPMWVAACDRAWLHASLQAFEAARRRVARVVPAHAPRAEGSLPAVHVEAGAECTWVVRSGSDGVQALPLGPGARAVLRLDDLPDAPSADPEVAHEAEEMLGRPVRVEHGTHSLALAAESAWDMAQFDLTSTGTTRAARRASEAWASWSAGPEWRAARWGAGALLLVQLAGLNAWAWRERSTLQSQRDEVAQLLRQAFPKVQLVVNAPVQMEREVAALRQATGAVSPRDAEPILAAVARHAPQPRVPSGIEFAAGELTLKGFQLAPEESAALRQALASTGYDARADGDNWAIKPRAPGPSASGGPSP